MERTILCLANSYKHGGRCVAGVCLETGEWLRLRGQAEDGALTPNECHLADGGGELRLLDVFSADVHYAMPTDCHPEDWVVSRAPWRLLQRPCDTFRLDLVASSVEALSRGATILGGYKDRIAAGDLERKPAKSSLALIRPEHLWWWNREERGKRKHRALFHRNNVTFDLPVTDPQWLDQMKLLPNGIYPHAALAPGSERTWLTISLSEAFEPRPGAYAWHFRLVAGVITL